MDPPQSETVVRPASLAQQARAAAQLRARAGATLQKIYLASARVAALQLRVPGQTLLFVVDARLGLAAELAERPQPEGEAPKAQATLRAALSGASLVSARLEQHEASGPASQQRPALRVSFATPQGPRALVAEPRAGTLALLAPDAKEAGRERIVWMSAAFGDLRAGAHWPPVREVEVDEAALEEAAQEPGNELARDDPATAQQQLAAEQARELEARRRTLLRELRGRAQKLARTLQAVEKDAARAGASGAGQREARLLLPEQSRVPRGAREVQVPDWSQLDADGKPLLVTLRLDPALSAAANAARWLKRAQRYAAAGPRIEARKAEVRRALAEAEAFAARAATSDAAELRELSLHASAGASAEAREEPARRGRARPPSRLPYRSFRASGGARILVGRSARDNDALSFKVARGNDLWLHARGVQGSHVIVPDVGAAPDAQTLVDAALLAAHFSSARGEPLVEVAWTQRKHLRKPRGAKAGSVLVTQETVLRVRVEPERVAALLAAEEK